MIVRKVCPEVKHTLHNHSFPMNSWPWWMRMYHRWILNAKSVVGKGTIKFTVLSVFNGINTGIAPKGMFRGRKRSYNHCVAIIKVPDCAWFVVYMDSKRKNQRFRNVQSMSLLSSDYNPCKTHQSGSKSMFYVENCFTNTDQCTRDSMFILQKWMWFCPRWIPNTSGFCFARDS